MLPCGSIGCGYRGMLDLQLMLGFLSLLSLSNFSHPHWCLHTPPRMPLFIPLTINWRNVLSSSTRNSS